MKENPLVYLASRSPRRRALLDQIGICHALLEVDVDERKRPDEDPIAYVLRLAREKAEAGAALVTGDECLPVLAADTCVVVENRVLGKPEDRDHGLWMLRQLSGRTHQVYTGVALGWRSIETELSCSEVSFRVLSDTEIAAYWATGEPADKAGGYAIQGVAARFICMLRGSYSGVMGLPLFETAELLSRSGIQLKMKNKSAIEV